jgi:exosortase/archaeosortase family protein
MKLNNFGRGGLKLTKTQKRFWKTFVFLLRLLILSIPLYVILIFNVDLYALQYSVTANTLWILRGVGYQVVQEGAALTVGAENPFFFIISPDSTGWKSMLFLFALIFAVPGVVLKKRVFGLVFGIPLIWIGNLTRVLAIVFIERGYGFEAAMLAHDYLWRLGLISLVLVLWLLWYFKIAKVRK